ncbi:MAG: beta-hydroxyacyl-ACP dehydratase [Paludibacteraceae bacterium]|nr:beta-hydroxyacyl-ACP dehydratase [Paludibacteraceae bacterium]
MLIDTYYSVERIIKEEAKYVFYVKLDPECEVYKGHFPDMPVSPGVCNIQMIKECCCEVAGKELFLGSISQCKFSSLVTPSANSELRVAILMTESNGTYAVRASISDKQTLFMDMKAEFTEA